MPSTDLVILRELLAREPGFVSGTALAAKLGVSRVAIWQHLEKLREQGFGFEAVKSRGYRLTGRPTELNALLIAAQLKARARDLPLMLLDQVDSTNDEAARQLAAGRPAPFVILARQQTKGRGRLGRSWHSEANGNFYASFAFRPQLSPQRMPTFTLWMGVNVCEVIANFTGLRPGLKWPNDILFDGRKAGGMLTEARIDSDQIRDLIFGLGLNVNAPAGTWTGELARRATSLAVQAGAPLDGNRFAAALIGRVFLAYNRFVEGEHLDTFADAWNRHDVLRGQPVAVLQGAKRIAGTARGIDDAGSLLIRDRQGRTHRFNAGEVTLEKAG
jgi:BirA family biotin operon repressor/biotin-[acetyl-CoA-carboxylase] ligase